MSSDEKVAQVVEFAIAKLNIGPNDVLVVQPPTDWTPSQRAYFNQHLQEWGTCRGLGFPVLVVPAGCELTVASKES